MNFLEMTKSRYAVRQFKSNPVEKEKLDNILRAIQNAPTAHNNQPQKIYVMQTAEALETVDVFTRGRFNAPIVFVLCYDKNSSWKRKDGYDSGEVDCGIIGTHIMFEALEQGLGSCWVAMFHKDILKEKMQIEDNIVPIAVIPVGYPAADSKPYVFHENRKDISDTVTIR